ncbi:hypothetical protein QCA50_005793 [Cerrena zonata]|uniref:Uncharacterized protein n=1 Tax=Cerrena zonata TaxID=2478898 RepID=A0AAW0GHQ3_9APHY
MYKRPIGQTRGNHNKMARSASQAVTIPVYSTATTMNAPPSSALSSHTAVATDPRPSRSPMAVARDSIQFYANQPVEVRIHSNRWVCGIVVCIGQVCQWAGAKVRVRIDDNGNSEVRQFDRENVRLPAL